MKKLIISSLGAFCTIFAGALSAQNCYECFDPCNALITVEADYLYWTAKQNDREFARLTTLTSTPESTNVDVDQIKQVKDKWNSGYRLGVGYRPCDCLWSVDVVYTHFQAFGKKHVEACFPSASSSSSSIGLLSDSSSMLGSGTFIEPAINPFDSVLLANEFNTASESKLLHAQHAKSHSKFKMDLGDINLLRHSFCSTNCINVNFLFGIRGGRLSSNWNTHYLYPATMGQFTSDILTGFTQQNSKINWNYLCIGPRFGAVGDVEIGCGFSLYGNVSASLLYGKIKRLNTTTMKVPTLIGSDQGQFVTTRIENIRKGNYKLTPVLQAEAGVAYTYVCDQFSIQGRIGIEMMSWINLAENTHYTFLNGARAKDSISNLDLYGLTTGVVVGF